MPPPIVFVDGLFRGGASPESLKEAGNTLTHTPIIQASGGPVSSAHDRACEIFFQLFGGRVDYGTTHSIQAGHDRWGVTYEKGSYPEWSREQPIHLVSFSFGAITARMLQNLLANNAFPGIETDASWIRSITTIQGPNNGANAVYDIGLDKKSQLPRKWTVLWIIFKFCMIYAWLNSSLLKWITGIDLHLGHWGRTRQSGHGLLTLLHSSVGLNDNAGADLSPIGAEKVNRATTLSPSTYYFAFSSTLSDSDHMLSRLLMRWPQGIILFPLALCMRWKHGIFSQGSASDGVVSLRSQKPPVNDPTSHTVTSTDLFRDVVKPKMGEWVDVSMPSLDHLEMSLPTANARMFVVELCQYLAYKL